MFYPGRFRFDTATTTLEHDTGLLDEEGIKLKKPPTSPLLVVLGLLVALMGSAYKSSIFISPPLVIRPKKSRNI
jgi:hypothetical protein